MVSFSKKVKKELEKVNSFGRHCNIAELAAMMECCSERIEKKEEKLECLVLQTENISVSRRAFWLIEDIFKICAKIIVRRRKKVFVYTLVLEGTKTVQIVMETLKLKQQISPSGSLFLYTDHLVVQNTCCKRAFIRGAFLSVGSVADPEKTYHLEMVFLNDVLAQQLQTIMNSFEVEAKIISRKHYYVVYLKEGSQIVELLNIMQAPIALMELENVRILKEVRNSVNRKVNCETANIQKTVTAASRQIQDINYIKNTVGLEYLTEGLEEIAQLRIDYPDATLKELGDLLCPKVGKSGVNHRLKKLCSIAEVLREKEGKSEMITKKITIQIPAGLEARPVALLVQVASQFESSIYIECGKKRVNAKSIMGMMSMGLPEGEEIVVVIEGVDEKEAMENIEKYLCGK